MRTICTRTRTAAALAGIILAVIANPSAAQKIYKCITPQATVYSQLPCSSSGDQTELVIKQAPPPQRTEAEIANMEAIQRNANVASAAYREQLCRRGASDNAWRPANAAIARHEAQIRTHEAEIARARNNLAGATFQAGIREQISTLNQLITTERGNALARESEGQARCAEQRAETERQAQQKSSTAPTTPPDPT